MPILYVIIFIPQKSVKNLFLVRQRGFKLAFPDGEGEFKTIQPRCARKHLTTSLRSKTPYNLAGIAGNYISFVAFGATFGMIQQERQNNIINILGGHSYAM